MDIETIELYCEYEVLIDKDIKGLSLQELFDLKFEILRLTKVLMEKLGEVVKDWIKNPYRSKGLDMNCYWFKNRID